MNMILDGVQELQKYKLFTERDGKGHLVTLITFKDYVPGIFLSSVSLTPLCDADFSRDGPGFHRFLSVNW